MKNILFLLFLGFSLLYQSALATTIGISFPNTTSPRWQAEGKYLTSYLEEEGYSVHFEFAENNVKNQISDIEKMLDAGCDILVIAPVDSMSLTKVLTRAKAQNIPVIAYDRLILDSDAVHYFATFDHYAVGVEQAKYIVNRLHLDGSASHTFNIEIFSGSPTGTVGKNTYEGSMSVLKPYFDKGILICPSGQTEFSTTATMYWKGSEAHKRLNNLFELLKYGKNEGQRKLDVLLSASDTIATGLVKTLTRDYGYTRKNMPLITGQDCSKDAARNIRKGLQSMCVFKDSRILAFEVTEMIKNVLSKTAVPVNNTSTYHNGIKVIPTYLCNIKVVDKNNLKEILIDSGYYTPKDIR